MIPYDARMARDASIVVAMLSFLLVFAGYGQFAEFGFAVAVLLFALAFVLASESGEDNNE